MLSKTQGFKLCALTDLVVMGLLIGQIIGRWGNFMNREAFGAETTLPWRMQLRTGEQDRGASHLPVREPVESGGPAADRLYRGEGRRFDGENTWFYFLWYGLGRFWIEGLRTDSLYLFNWTIGGAPIRVSQALSAVMVLVSAFLLVWNLWVKPHKPEELYVNIAAAQKAAEGESADGSAE